MEHAVMRIFALILLFAFTGQTAADTTIAMETDMQEAGTCSVGDPSCSDEAIPENGVKRAGTSHKHPLHVDAVEGTMLLATSKARKTAKFTSQASCDGWAIRPDDPWDDRASQMEDFINCICGQMKTETACTAGDGPTFCQWFECEGDPCEDEPVCQNKPVTAMGCEHGEVSCYHGGDALCPDGLLDQYTCSADGQLVAKEGEPSPPPMLSNKIFTSLQDLSPFVRPVLAEEEDEVYLVLCDDASDPQCDLCLEDDVSLSYERCEAGIGLTELGKGKKKTSKKGGKKAAKKSSKKGAKKSSPKIKGHAAMKHGKGKTVTKALNHYAASNGKWTIGGLNKPDIFSLITHNGMA